mgnify:CR=1 FL=1
MRQGNRTVMEPFVIILDVVNEHKEVFVSVATVVHLNVVCFSAWHCCRSREVIFVYICYC